MAIALDEALALAQRTREAARREDMQVAVALADRIVAAFEGWAE